MPQFGRPSADTFRNNWETHAGGTANLFQQIDEVVQDNDDFIRTVLAPTAAVYVTKLSTIEDPVSSSGHVVRYAYAKDAANGAQINLTVQLREGYVNEGTLGTLIKEWVHTNIGNTVTLAQQTLSGGEADSIGDYSDLFLRFVGNQV